MDLNHSSVFPLSVITGRYSLFNSINWPILVTHKYIVNMNISECDHILCIYMYVNLANLFCARKVSTICVLHKSGDGGDA